MRMYKVVLLGLFALASVSMVSAQDIPEVHLSEDYFNFTEVEVGDGQEISVIVTNQDQNRSVNDVRMQDASYVEWNETDVQINASDTFEFNGVINPETQREINESLTGSFSYEGTDSNFDLPEIRYEFDAVYPEADLDVEYHTEEFEVPLDETRSGIISIRNQGDELARNVTVEGEDMEFDLLNIEEPFDLEAGDSRVIEFETGIPIPDSADEEEATDMTNQSYTRTGTFSSINSEDATFDVEIDVPFEEFDDLRRQEDFIEMLRDIQDFCQVEENQDLPVCGGDIDFNETGEEEEINVYEAEFTEEEFRTLQNLSSGDTDFTEDIAHEVELLNNAIQDTRDTLEKQRTEDREEMIDELETTNDNLQTLIEEQQRQQEMEEESRMMTRTRGIYAFGGLFFIFIISSLGIGGYYLIREARDDRWFK